VVITGTDFVLVVSHGVLPVVVAVLEDVLLILVLVVLVTCIEPLRLLVLRRLILKQTDPSELILQITTALGMITILLPTLSRVLVVEYGVHWPVDQVGLQLVLLARLHVVLPQVVHCLVHQFVVRSRDAYFYLLYVDSEFVLRLCFFFGLIRAFVGMVSSLLHDWWFQLLDYRCFDANGT
jgi:hypothetical protein